ncbi:hypothetical protein RRU94_15785 [Domibacillus sp. DTU_2020_1001157_1_SI_ALB_TIR_016]|uniref:hypothetical protein n=1 Tax=Domibacillus sp. DTU_2020_1001157_1_SI_ALB_TIR_016 TaxID=3077789 RepID=UPI0028E8754B|nr:hypothetical protein [Domibacillus sp. DTU_2020_1001157_1_SI_ALB_TIR_016]WNS82203.1 hypothetical protein RRU94_15785 [Domibacillus sp. DTU_2020_1001157_1_SI_ALB_TIR_016]
MKKKVEKLSYFDREEITRHEKLQRAKELYIDFQKQENHTSFSKYSPKANSYVMQIFDKYKPNQIKAFCKYVGIRKKQKNKLVTPKRTSSSLINPHLTAYAQLGLRFESKVKEILLVLNQHKKIDFQVVIPVKGHNTNTSYLKPDIVINDDIWIDCKLSKNSNLKETAIKYEGHCRILEFYVLMNEGIDYGVDESSGQIIRSIWSVIQRGKGKLGEELAQHYYNEFKRLEQEYINIKENGNIGS